MSKNEGYIRIPITILLDKQLSDLDKLVFGVVWGLTWQKGHCYARNRFIADTLSKHPNTISGSISKLDSLEYINNDIDRMRGNIRRITVNQDKVSAKTLEGRSANGEHEYNNEYVGNRKENSSISTKSASFKEIGANEAEDGFMKWFCEHRSIKGFTDQKRQLEAIGSCFKVGYNAEDLKKVVEKMERDSWWVGRGFDLTDLAKQAPKLSGKDPDGPKFDNPPWI